MDSGMTASDEREAKQLLGIVVVLLLLAVAPILLPVLREVGIMVLGGLTNGSLR